MVKRDKTPRKLNKKTHTAKKAASAQKKVRALQNIHAAFDCSSHIALDVAFSKGVRCWPDDAEGLGTRPVYGICLQQSLLL
jgi:hypothetical protein